MVTFYLVVKMLHIILAVIALGFSGAFYVILSGTPKPGPEWQAKIHLCHRLETISVPCFVLLLLSGLGMRWLGNLSWGTLWYTSSLGIMVVALVLGIAVGGPTLKRQVAVIDSPNPDIAELAKLNKRSTIFRTVLMLMALTMMSMMIFKPTLD